MFIAAHVLAVLFLAFVCHGAGRAVIGRLPFDSGGLRAAVAAGLGFGIIGQLLFAIGSVGALTRPVVLSFLLILAIPAVLYVRELWTLALRTPKSVLLVLVVAPLFTFLRALYPPAGSDPT